MVKMITCIVMLVLVGGIGQPVDGTSYRQREKNSVVQQAKEVDKVLEEVQKQSGATSQIRVLDLQYKSGVLEINLSKEAVAYGGGNEAEYRVIQTLLRWGFEAMEAESMTIKIEGSISGFPEGSEISGYTKEAYEKNYQ